jgi:hypothetical protein
MKVTTTMSREEFNKWLRCLRKGETDTRQMPRAELSSTHQTKQPTMQQVMVSWTIEDWRRAK